MEKTHTTTTVQCKTKQTAGKNCCVILPIGCPHSVGPLAGISWSKSQSPRYFPGLGPWLEFTDALHRLWTVKVIEIDKISHTEGISKSRL